MKAKLALVASVAAVGIAGPAMADSSSAVIGQSWGATPGTAGPLTSTITLPGVASIDSIVVELAHTWGGDLEIAVAGPGGSTFDLMFHENTGIGLGTNFDMGIAAGSGAASNIAPYTFVASGGTATFASPHAAPGTYNANSWTAGAIAAGDYTITINDQTTGDGGAVGSWTINYTPIPTPGALALLGLAGFVGSRRRRS